MTVLTIKCSECGRELLIEEIDNVTVLTVDPCPDCLREAYNEALDDGDDSDWEDDDYDDDDDDYEDYEDDWDDEEEEDL